jgi:hypothetical protein
MSIEPEIVVTVDGCLFNTIIDDEGVQRFPKNRVVCLLLDSGRLNLIDISMMADHDIFSTKELMSFYMDLGYSVSGFVEVFADKFDHESGGTHTISNPLWEYDDG